MVICIYPLKNISPEHHNLMVKALVNLTARVVCLHKDMAPLISRIHSGFMVERSLQAVENDIQKMQDVLRELREALKAPIKTDSSDYTLLK
jgi:prefoldin subunit 5